MSLLDEFKEEYVLLNKVKVPDGYGGATTTWEDGPTILVTEDFENSIEGRKAQASGVTSVYTLYTSRSVTLDYHDVLRRVRDGKIFRVTSDGDDDYTPPSAGLDLRAVSAEEWELD